MHIEAGMLESIEEDGDVFMQVFSDYTVHVLHEARLFPKLSKLRVIEAHGAWRNDMHRVSGSEPELEEGLDHFKRCGHLTFWIRRMSPVVEAYDLTAGVADAPGMPITEDEQAFRDLLFGYCNEYLAFDFGFQFCRFYEMNKNGRSPRAEGLALDEDYIRTVCHFLKYKSVSPHAIFLIYKSLFHS